MICLSSFLQRLLVRLDDISSSYSYQRCGLYVFFSDGSRFCLRYAPAIPGIMDVLKLTPPFFYSYQCGSTLLTSYLPVHMYSISLQIISTIVSLIIIFSSSNLTHHPRWLLSLFPGVCWPSHWQSVKGPAIDLHFNKKPICLIKPHQIISRTMNNIILLLSFGLCSPVLCAFITVSICAVGRFVSLRIDALQTLRSPSPSTDARGEYYLLVSEDGVVASSSISFIFI
jgi:hypothetical protein